MSGGWSNRFREDITLDEVVHGRRCKCGLHRGELTYTRQGPHTPDRCPLEWGQPVPRNRPPMNDISERCGIINRRVSALMRPDLRAATTMHAVRPSAAWSCVVVRWEGVNKAKREIRIDPRYSDDLDQVLNEFLDRCKDAKPCDCRYSSHGETCVHCGAGPDE